MWETALDFGPTISHFLKKNKKSKIWVFISKFPHGIIASSSEFITVISERIYSEVNGIDKKSLA